MASTGVTHLEDHRPKGIAIGCSDRHDEKYQCPAVFTSATILDHCHHFRVVVVFGAENPIVRSASASSARVVGREGFVKDEVNASISTARKRLSNDE